MTEPDPLPLTEAEIEAVLDYGVDVRGRRIFLHGDVDEDSIGTAIRGLYLLDGMSHDTIELYVASYGGALDDAFALHDVTRTIKAPISTCALGKCQSAAPMLVACGQKGERYATENCSFMLHNASLSSSDEDNDTPENLLAHAEAGKECMERYARLLARYSKLGVKHWRAMLGGTVDRFFSTDDAVKWGLVDTIWAER